MKKAAFLAFVVLLFLQSVFSQETFFQTGHTHDILEVRFSPDDSQLVSYSAGDGRFCLWEVKTGRLIWMTKTTFNENIYPKEFFWSEEGKFIVTKSRNGSFQTWDARTGKIQSLTDSKPEIKLNLPKENKQIKVNNSASDTSNDGTMIAEGGRWGDASIRITETQKGKSWQLDGHPSVIGGISFSPDGKYLAVGGSDKTIFLFDVAQKEVFKTLVGHSKPIKKVLFSPNGQILVSVDDYGLMKVWNWQTGQIIKELQSDNGINEPKHIEFSKNGNYFLMIVNGGIGIFETITWNYLRSLKTKEGYESKSSYMTSKYSSVPISAAAFIENGEKVLTTHDDETMRIWEIKTGKEISKFKVGENHSLLAVTNKNQAIIPIGKWDKQKLKLFDIKTGKEIQTYYEEYESLFEGIAVSPKGDNFITSDSSGDVFRWNVYNNKSIREFKIGYSGDDAIAFSPDGKTFAIGGRNQNLYLFDVESGKKLWQLIPSYQQSDMEKRLSEEARKRREILDNAQAERDKQSAIDTEMYKKQVFIKLSHYGDMSDPGNKKMAESDEPKESLTKKSRQNSNAVWLRLYNNSPLPIEIPTQSFYFPDSKCFFTFPGGKKVNGLCDSREVNIWHGLKDKNGEWIPFGFDFGSSSILLPKTSVLFPVPLAILKNGNSIAFNYKFQNENRDKIDDYGTAKELKFSKKDLPK